MSCLCTMAKSQDRILYIRRKELTHDKSRFVKHGRHCKANRPIGEEGGRVLPDQCMCTVVMIKLKNNKGSV